MDKSKFKQHWTSTVIIGDDVPDGKFDLTNMDENGDGGFQDVNGARLQVHAEITTTSNGFEVLELTNENGNIYRGVLVFDSAGHKHMIVAGKLHVKPGLNAKEREAKRFDQDDPPWVITKP